MIRFEIIWDPFRLLWVALGGEKAGPDNCIQKPGKESWTLVNGHVIICSISISISVFRSQVKNHGHWSCYHL